MKFEILTAAKISMVIFWAVTPCELVSGNRRFGDIFAFIFSPRVKWSELFRTETKNGRNSFSIPPYVFMVWCIGTATSFYIFVPGAHPCLLRNFSPICKWDEWVCKGEVKKVRRGSGLEVILREGEFIYLGFEPQTFGDGTPGKVMCVGWYSVEVAGDGTGRILPLRSALPRQNMLSLSLSA
jgi:hypothetical protein